MINQNECLSEVDKFPYLRSLLLGLVKLSIAGFALTAMFAKMKVFC